MFSKYIRSLFAAVFLYVFAGIFSTHALEDIKFIDVDEFHFAKAGLKSGLRICVFGVQTQTYESITYYNLPATQDRKRDDMLLQGFHGISISYTGDITVPVPLKGVIIRTKGTISGPKSNFSQWADEEKRNLAFETLPVVIGSELKEVLNTGFSKGPYNQTSFNVTSCTLPSRTKASVTLDSISGDTQENNHERGSIGELATRITLFCCGFYEKLPSQDNSGQGIDGVYIQRDKSNALTSLYLTESKCKNASVSPKKILQTQLTEKALFENIGRLDLPYRTMVLDFIASSPNKVFKAAHRILITGKSQWRVEELDFKGFQVLRTGVSSPAKDKEIIIASISPKFNSPVEMLRAVFGHYQIDTDSEKLALFHQAIGCTTERLETLLEDRKHETDASDPREVKQDPQEDPKRRIARKLTYDTPVKKETKQEIKVEYSRENLSIFLTVIKKQFKRGACDGINNKLKELDSDSEQLTASTLSQLSDFANYPNFHKTIDHKPLWDLLVKAFPSEYKQAIADGKFSDEAA